MKEGEVMTVYQRVRSYVKSYAKNNGLKQAFIAQQMGFTEKRFSELLNGNAVMKIEDLERICNYFGVPATTFIKTETEAGEGA